METDFSIKWLNEIMEFDYEAGKIFWLPRTSDMFSSGGVGSIAYAKAWNKRFATKEAFTSINGAGYRHGTIFGNFYLAHRLIFASFYGFWPEIIDHRNGNRSDNRIENLENVTNSMNLRNCKKFRHNTSGITGVVWDKSKNCWKAQIKVDRKNKFLGNFKNIEDARDARLAAEIKFNFSTRHGKD